MTCTAVQTRPDLVSALLELEPLFNRPIPVALWLVDSPEWKEAILFRFDVKLSHERDLFDSSLPLYEWWTWAEQEGDEKPGLPFLKSECRGLWIEMRNADHIRVVLPS